MSTNRENRRRIKLPVKRLHTVTLAAHLAAGPSSTRFRPQAVLEDVGTLVPNFPLPRPAAVVDPDLAIQTSPCLEELPGAPADVVDRVTSALQQFLGPQADVRYGCENGTGRIGAWQLPQTGLEAPDARDLGLSNLDLIPSGGFGAFGFLIGDALIQRQARAAFAALPKRLNTDGEPDPDGRVHLQSLTVEFESPSRVITRVKGFYDAPGPGRVSFEQTITDTLSASGGEVQCTTETELDIDAGFLRLLLGVFLFLAAVISPAFLLGLVAVATAGILIGSVEGPQVEAGAGCAAAALIPAQLNVPGGHKIVPSYLDVDVDDRGIVAKGFAILAARTPTVAIRGPHQTAAIEGESSLTRRFEATESSDLLPPLSFDWHADGTVATPTAIATSVAFDVSGSSAGDVLTRSVSVQVTDADGLTVDAQATVAIHVTTQPGDVLPGVPPICLRKPWLPECRLGDR